MADWKKYYEEHLVNLVDAAKAIKSGDTIFMGSTLCVPAAFMDALAERYEELENVTLMANMYLAPTKIMMDPKYKKTFHTITLFANVLERMAAKQNNIDFHAAPYARSILQYLMNGTYELDGLVQTDGCMMQARILDNWEHISKLNGKEQFCRMIGAPRMTDDYTIEFYKSELAELVADLEKLTGNKITDEDLKTSIKKHNEMRKLMEEVYALRQAEKPVVTGAEVLSICLAECDTTVDEYIAMLKEFLAEAKTRKPIEARARLMVIGSALDNPEFIKVIEEKGGIVVTDDLCFTERAFGKQLEIDDSDVLGSIARYYLTRNTCPRSLDNRIALHQEILEKCKKYNVQGVIYQKMQNCECWGGESYYLEPTLKEAGIPILQLEREEQMANAGQLAIRAEAFIEMLED